MECATYKTEHTVSHPRGRLALSARNSQAGKFVLCKNFFYAENVVGPLWRGGQL